MIKESVVIAMEQLSYTVYPIEMRTWIIEEKTSDSQGLIYLLEGDESSLLIDTGLGTGDLKAVTDRLTSKPVSVICTHCNFDHIACNYQFKNIYIHKDEDEVLADHSSSEYLHRMRRQLVPDTYVSSVLENYFNIKPSGACRHIEDGHVFDLGNREIEAIHVPGHSPGSVCLLDRLSRRLFSGDTVCDWGILLHLDYSDSPEVFLRSIRRLKAREGEFEVIYPGHHKFPLDKGYIDEYIECAEGIINGSISYLMGPDHIYKEAAYGRIRITLP